MKSLSFILILVIAAAAFAEDPSYTSTNIWIRSNPAAAVPTFHSQDTDAPMYYTNLATFEAANPGLTPEDYSSTLIPANSVASDTGPLDYYTNNSLFALNTIVQGISLDEQAGGLMVVLTPPFAGVTSVTVGPNTFTDNAVYNFTLPTRAFGGFIVMPNGGATVTIDVYGVGGVIGTTTATGATGGGAFWGVSCYDEEIVSITFNCLGGDGELFANVQFGLPTALARTTWGELKAAF